MGLLSAPQWFRSRPGRTVAALFGFCAVVLVTPIGASAGTPTVRTADVAILQTGLCATGLVDESGEIDGAEVADAIAEFIKISPGTSVYVRVYDDNTDLDAAREEILAQCGTASDYLFVAIDVPSQQSSVFGSALGNQLAEDIRTGTMRENLQAGDLTGGLFGALRDSATVVDSLDDDITIERDAPEPETEASNLGSYILAGSVIGLAGVGGGVMVRNRRRQMAVRRQTFATKVAEPRVRMGAARERDARLSAQGERFSHTVDGRTLDQLRHLQNQVATAGNDAERLATLLTKATPDGIESASNEELSQGESRLAEFSDALDRYQIVLDKLTAFGELLDRLRVALPTKKGLLLDELDDAEALAAERTNDGWEIHEATERLAQARTTVVGLDFDDLRLDLLELSNHLEAAEGILFAARHDVESVVDRPQGIADWASELETVELTEALPNRQNRGPVCQRCRAAQS